MNAVYMYTRAINVNAGTGVADGTTSIVTTVVQKTA